MEKTKRIIVLVFIIAGLGIGLFLTKGLFLPLETGNKETQLFSIEKGQSAFVIASNLEKQGLIKNRLSFLSAATIRGGISHLQTGLYYLSPGYSAWKIAAMIAAGDIAQETITIPEGWNIKEIGRGLAEFEIADFSQEFSFLESAPANANLEGFLFPDTYEIKIGEIPGNIAKIMLTNFDKKLTTDLHQEIEKQGKTIFEIITMASLLEKEGKTIADKELIAGILWKRLKIGMRLQVDATVLYALGREPGPVSYDDLKVDSLYNTYKYAGLPAGPIANPGLESINATIYPTQSDYWYYLSGPDNTIYFSQTLEEHNQKKLDIRKGI